MIDSDYQGQLMVGCSNRGAEAFELKPKERLAHLVLVPEVQASFRKTDDFAASVRGVGGFASSGAG